VSVLRELEAIHRQYGRGVAEQKRSLLARLARNRLRSARAVSRLHECLCFLRAYPDNQALLDLVERMLADFARRPDLRRFRAELRDSGIAGTMTYYSFFHPTAKWLAACWPGRLFIDWAELEHPERLEQLLPLMALPAEVPGLDEAPLSVREWIRRMKGPDETDAAFLLRRVTHLPARLPFREIVFEDLGLMFRLAPGPGTPSRTRARVTRPRVHYVTRPLATGRPDLHRAMRERPRTVTPVSPAEGRRLIDLAREAMVTRSRDLDAFAYGDPRDVRIVDFGDGLEFLVIGTVPERRLMLEAVYGFLTLKNGVPIGYVLNSALFNSAEVAYNVFDTYRGVEAAHVYGRVLATIRHLFNVTAFTIYPYQLGGDGNEEGIRSGAWWFYQKLGFRARDPEVLALMERELTLMREDPRHRSSSATLRRLARANVFFIPGRPRIDVIGLAPLGNVGLAVTDLLAARYGSDRERASAELEREVARLLGVRSRRGWSPGERESFRRWAPVVAALPGVDRWPASDRRALAAIMRAKGGQRESDFVRQFDAHRRLRAATLQCARRADEAK